MNPDDPEFLAKILDDEDRDLDKMEKVVAFEPSIPGKKCSEFAIDYVSKWNEFKRSLDTLVNEAKLSCTDLDQVRNVRFASMYINLIDMDSDSDNLANGECINDIPLVNRMEFVTLARTMSAYANPKLAKIQSKYIECGFITKPINASIGSPKQRSNNIGGEKSVEKCTVKTVDKRMNIMPSGTVNYIEFFTAGKEKFKIESDQFYNGSTAGLALKSFDHGWNDVNFFVTHAVKDIFKSVKAASVTIDPYVEKIRRFAMKFSGCD